MMKSYRQLLEEKIARLASELAEASAELASYQALRGDAARPAPEAQLVPQAPTFEMPAVAPMPVAPVVAAPAPVMAAAPVAPVMAVPVAAPVRTPVTVEQLLAAPISNPQLLAAIPAPRPVAAAPAARAVASPFVQEPELVEPDSFFEEATQAIEVHAAQQAQLARPAAALETPKAVRRSTLEETRAVQASIEEMFAQAEAIMRPPQMGVPKLWYQRPANIAIIAASVLAFILTMKVALRDDPPPPASLGAPTQTMMGPTTQVPVAPATAPGQAPAAPVRPTPGAPTSAAPDAPDGHELSEGSGALAQASERLTNRRTRHARRRH